MTIEMTRERLVEACARMRESAAARDPRKVPAPRFIREMTLRELCEWDVALYELALEGLAARDAARELEAASRGLPACNLPTHIGSPGLGCSRVEGHEGECRS